MYQFIKFLFLSLFILLLNEFSLQAQTKIDKFYQYDRTFKKLYKKAQSLRDDGQYSNALACFLKLDSMIPNNPNINFNIGLCYINSTDQKTKSIPYLEIATQNVSKSYSENYKEQRAPVYAYFYLGKALHVAYQLDRAIEKFKKFNTYFFKKDSLIIKESERQIEMIGNAKDLMSNPLDIKIENLGLNINTEYSDYSPVITNDNKTIIFTSRRKGSTGNKLDAEKKFYEDVYTSTKNPETDEWSIAEKIGSNINTSEHEASVSLSSDGNQLFIYRNNTKKENGDIFVTKRMKDAWSTPEKLPFPINTKSWETHAFILKDGKTIYFISNREGGYGGRDIYMCKKDENNRWGKVSNLGPSINTEYEEDSPYIVEDTSGITMFFCSQGHKSMGGFDIFTSKLKSDGTWTNAENIIYPINTTDDDVFYTPTVDKKHAYYSSSKIGGYGDLDIYYLTILGFEKEKHIAKLKGTILDVTTLKPVNSKLILKDESGSVIGEISCDTNNCNFEFIIDKGKKYEVSVTANNYLDFNEIVEIPGLDSNRNIEVYKRILLSKPLVVLHDTTKTIITTVDSVKCYTVQIAAGRHIKQSYFEKAIGYKVIPSSDGLKRYVVGEYNSKEEALNQKQKMNFLGYEDAFVKECFTSSTFVAGSSKSLEKIYFDFDKFDLRDESVVVLNKVLQMMKENANIRIKLLGHTDIIGSENYNQGLSEDRSTAALNYLIKNGIERTRLDIKGFSWRVPDVPNTSPQNRQLNRRVEFKLIGN